MEELHEDLHASDLFRAPLSILPSFPKEELLKIRFHAPTNTDDCFLSLCTSVQILLKRRREIEEEGMILPPSQQACRLHCDSSGETSPGSEVTGMSARLHREAARSNAQRVYAKE